MANYVEDYTQIMTVPASQWHKVFMKHDDSDEGEGRFHDAFMWCEDVDDLGLWSEWSYSDGSEFRFTNPDMAFAFKLRWA